MNYSDKIRKACKYMNYSKKETENLVNDFEKSTSIYNVERVLCFVGKILDDALTNNDEKDVELWKISTSLLTAKAFYHSANVSISELSKECFYRISDAIKYADENFYHNQKIYSVVYLCIASTLELQKAYKKTFGKEADFTEEDEVEESILKELMKTLSPDKKIVYEIG